MPPLVDIPNVLRVIYAQTVGADAEVIDRIYLKYSGTAPTNASCVTIAGLIHASYVTELVPMLNAANAIRAVEVTDLTTTSSGQGTSSSTVSGSRSGGELSAGAAALLNFSIGRRYRGGKPRAYFPFGSAPDLQTPQTWTSGFISALGVAFQLHVDDLLAITTGGIVITGLVNVSYYSGFNTVGPDAEGRFRYPPKPRTAAITPDAITGFAVNPKVGSQRRRNLHSS